MDQNEIENIKFNDDQYDELKRKERRIDDKLQLELLKKELEKKAFSKKEHTCKHNNEQSRFINSPIESSSLIGIPGGGKSTCIVDWIIKNLVSGTLQQNEILLLVFNKDIRNDLANKLKNYDLDEYIRTFDSLSEIINKGYGNIVKKPPNFSKLSEGDKKKTEYHKQVMDNCLHNLKNTQIIPFIENIKVIIVDEAQDINLLNHMVIKQMSKKLKNIPIILVGDPNQSLYISLRKSNPKYLTEHKGTRHRLKINYRSTEQIVEFSQNFIQNKYDIISSNKTAGPKPIYITSDNNDLTLNDMIKKIVNVRKNNIEYYDIAIITYFRKYQEESSVAKITEYLKKNNIPTGKNGVNILTYYTDKGLEYHTVIINDFQDWWIIRNDSQELKQNLQYVSITRAKQNLIIYYNKYTRKSKNDKTYRQKNNAPELLRNVPNHLYEEEYLYA